MIKFYLKRLYKDIALFVVIYSSTETRIWGWIFC